MSTAIRKFHRWVAMAFMVAVILNFIAVRLNYRAVWVGILAAVPLFLLVVTGLSMFFQPYFARWKRGGQGLEARQST